MIEAEYKSAVLAAGKAWLTRSLFRGADYSITFNFRNIDYSAATFAAQLRLTPDAVGDPVATFTAAAPVFSGGDTQITFRLTDMQTDALPAAAETGRTAKLFADFKITVGGLTDRFAAAAFTITGKVTP